ncbi:hypothetical protein B0H65DRAFT_550324 [Neurospora tetraspora]|uniref:Uncharacterized protein n=1 Tax=Neurospora tetraspora TaxID=94610 RepID=A0AAE0JDP0_9PEZI|nr:hypothetical protein B0H65DRAFT_550324 [Neurospora tetraspora]
MRTFPALTFTRKALLLSALAHLASIALTLPQNQGTSYTLSSRTVTSTTSSSTHLSPSLIHSSLPTPTADNDQAERNDQGADVTTETIFSTIIIPTATELTTILTVVTNAPHDTTPSASLITSSTSKPAAPNPHCIVEGGEDGICVTVVPIWPTDTLAQAVKRQVNSNSISYYSTALVTSTVVVHPTITKVLTAIHAPNTTYTLIGP